MAEMTFRIYYELNDGTNDYFELYGEDIELLQKMAVDELTSRGVDINTAWSEELT